MVQKWIVQRNSPILFWRFRVWLTLVVCLPHRLGIHSDISNDLAKASADWNNSSQTESSCRLIRLKSSNTNIISGPGTAYLPRHLSSSPVFSGVRVARSSVLYVCFVDRCLSFCTFSFGNCVVCSSSIYGFWLPLWYLQTLLLWCWNKCY